MAKSIEILPNPPCLADVGQAKRRRASYYDKKHFTPIRFLSGLHSE